MTNAKKSRRANDDDRDSYSISNAILEESMKLCSEFRSYVYFAVSLKSIRLVVFDTFPRAMHPIWSSFHVIVGALICTSAAISLAFAFDVSAMFFTMPLCFLAVGGRLMTPTEMTTNGYGGKRLKRIIRRRRRSSEDDDDGIK